MNPIAEKALGSVLRWVLALIVPFFVSNGIWTADESTEYLAAAVAALLALGWSLFEKYRSQITLLTAIAMPKGATQSEVETKVNSGETPPVTLSRDAVPYVSL